MATNKNAQLRYLILDECFSNFQRRFYIDDLIEEVNEGLSDYMGSGISISLRQIRDDIKFMRSLDGFNAPIITYRDGVAGYYRYEDKDFSIMKKPITATEIETLQEAILALTRVSGSPESSRFDTLLTRLDNEFGIRRPERQIISYEENEFLKGLEHLNPLYNYIINKQALKIKYQRYGEEEPFIFVMSPYFLKQYNNRWFLFGWNHEDDRIHNSPIDRILEIETVHNAYIDKMINFDEYFEEIIGVTNYENEEEEKILLKLSERRFPYVESKPMHGSQKSNRDNCTIELKLKRNRELISLILSYGRDLTVLEPESLRNEIIAIIGEMVENYGLQNR